MTDVDEALTHGLTQLIAERRIPGAGFVVFGLNRPTVRAVAGRRRSGSDTPVQLDDQWHIGSVTKAMTASVVLRLHERGILDVDETVLSGLEGTRYERAADCRHFGAVTIADLLSHRSGMRANPTNAVFALYVLGGMDRERVNAIAVRESLTRGIGPARSYTYSNSGYGVAGLIAAHRTGSSWQDLIEDHVAWPHHIDSLGFGRPEWSGDHPWGHRRRIGRPGYTQYRITKRGLDLELMRPAGDVHVSLAGLAQHGLLHLRQTRGEDVGLLAPASAARMYAPVGEACDPYRGGGYGLGWHVEDRAPDFGGGRFLWHNGSDLFSFALVGLLPDAGVGFAFVANAPQGTWQRNPRLVWEPVRTLMARAEPSLVE